MHRNTYRYCTVPRTVRQSIIDNSSESLSVRHAPYGSRAGHLDRARSPRPHPPVLKLPSRHDTGAVLIRESGQRRLGDIVSRNPNVLTGSARRVHQARGAQRGGGARTRNESRMHKLTKQRRINWPSGLEKASTKKRDKDGRGRRARRAGQASLLSPNDAGPCSSRLDAALQAIWLGVLSV